ncbi:MAG: rRNA maturation RNase YbeY [Cocleimonas sp.]
MIEVEIQNPDEFGSLPAKDSIQTWCHAALQDDKQDYSLVIRFVGTEESAHLNSTYRQKKSATNVLSFSYDAPGFVVEEQGEPKHLGDLVLCEPLVKKEAVAQNKDLIQHWAHLIIHGVLHLQGYDHVDDKSALIMESLEVKILQQQGFANPYVDR